MREGVPCPLGDTDLEPLGVEVEAKSDDTEALTPRYGRLATDDAIDGASFPRVFGSLSGDAIVAAGGLIAGESPRDILSLVTYHPADRLSNASCISWRIEEQ